MGNDWIGGQLGDFVQIGSSKRIFYKEYVPEGVPFYRSKEVIEKSSRKNVSTELYILHNRFKEIKEKFGVPQKGDILLTSVGTLGVPWVVDTDEDFYFKDGNLTWFKDFHPRLNNHFLFYWLVSPIGKNELEMSSIGSTQPALTIKGLKELSISIPPIEEQIAIIGVLSALDDKIDLLQRQNRTLESLAQALFRHWFIDGAGADWEEGYLDNLVTVSSGKGLKRSNYVENGSFPVLGANGEIGRAEEYLLDEEVIFTGRVGTLGNIFISKGKVWLSDNTLIASPKFYRQFHFVYFLLKTAHLEDLNVGSTQPLIRQSDVKQIEISIPPITILERFSAQTQILFAKIDINQSQICTLAALRDTLLPKLMSGEVRVRV